MNRWTDRRVCQNSDVYSAYRSINRDIKEKLVWKWVGTTRIVNVGAIHQNMSDITYSNTNSSQKKRDKRYLYSAFRLEAMFIVMKNSNRERYFTVMVMGY